MGLYIVQIEKFNGNKEKKLSLQRKKKSQRIHTRTIGLFPSRGQKQKNSLDNIEGCHFIK